MTPYSMILQNKIPTAISTGIASTEWTDLVQQFQIELNKERVGTNTNRFSSVFETKYLIWTSILFTGSNLCVLIIRQERGVSVRFSSERSK